MKAKVGDMIRLVDFKDVEGEVISISKRGTLTVHFHFDGTEHKYRQKDIGEVIELMEGGENA